ncbi:MAG: nucleotidyltransferase family protein [Acidobacteria bacterium]|nr:nucleotidyltransferase family protein [Acidobacteriota bacterium]MCA1641953.1 nucleotidyltransferase family protein [Acidobacteriota bacterium]
MQRGHAVLLRRLHRGGLHGVNGRDSRGALVASLLAGSWRAESSPPPQTDDEIAAVAPLLADSGAAALAWWRLRGAGRGASRVAEELRHAHRLNTLLCALQQEGIAEAFAALRRAGIEPVLLKGWSAARLYPDPGLRPAGDIDLFVRPEHRARARARLDGAGLSHYDFDLKHTELDSLDERGRARVYSRTTLVDLSGIGVRVLGCEDQLSFLCAHLMRHGARRPLWLCDVALALETLPADFDWDRCLGDNRRPAALVTCAIKLAATLLGARLDRVPQTVINGALPRWLVPAVIESWGVSPFAARDSDVLSISLRDPRRIPRAIRSRWADAVEASVRTHAPANDLPRLPFQLIDFVAQGARFFRRALSRPARSVDHQTPQA